MGEEEGREDEGNGDEFMSWPRGPTKRRVVQRGALPERPVAKSDRVIHPRQEQKKRHKPTLTLFSPVTVVVQEKFILLFCCSC